MKSSKSSNDLGDYEACDPANTNSSFFVMYPTLIESSRAMDQVLKSRSNVTDEARAAAFNAGIEKWKFFVRAHAGKPEVERFGDLARRFDTAATAKRSITSADTGHLAIDLDSWRILAPAFLVSELKSAFATGLTLFLPFLVIDLFVANVLVAVALERINPALVALPFKLMLFVLLDGWSMITTNLVSTYL